MKNYKIAIYKVGTNFSLTANDTNFAQQEIKNVINILRVNGNSIYILGDNKTEEDTFNNLAKIKFVNYAKPIKEEFDYLLVFNGPYPRNIINEYENLKHMTKFAKKSFFIVTDLRIKLYDQFHELFDKVLTQSKRQLNSIKAKQAYSGMPQSILFDTSFSASFNILPNTQQVKKDKLIVFGGNERNRTKDFIEYIIRPNVEYYGKSSTFSPEDNRLPTQEYMKLFRRTKYSIVIADKEYNQNGFITQRYYECLANDVIPFVDYKYDQDNIAIKQDDFRRVYGYEDVLKKIKILENDRGKYDEVIRRQQLEVYMNDGLYGTFTRKCLLQLENDKNE
jgi:hypothetical protein